MRKWIGSIFVVLLVLALLPAVFGLIAKRTLEQVVVDLPMPEGVSLTLENYLFGWLSSTVAIKIHVVENQQRQHFPDNTLDITVHGHITHGPLLMTEQGLRIGIAQADTHATLKDIKGLSPDTQAELAILFDDKDLLRARSLFYLNRNVAINLKSSVIQAQANGDTLQWNGFNGQININKDFTQLQSDFTISPVLFTTRLGAILDTAQMHFTTKLHRELKQPWVGEQMFNVPTFYLKDETGAVLRFDHLKVESQSNIINDMLQASLDVEANNIEFNNQRMDKMHFDVSVADFAKDPLLKLSQLMQSPQASENKQELMQLVTQALITGAKVDLDYVLTMEQNKVMARVSLKFPDIRDKVSSTADSIPLLLKGLNAKVDVMAPQQGVKDLLFTLIGKTWMQQMGAPLNEAQVNQIKQMIDAQMTALTQNNVVRAQENNYYFEFDYNQGNMTLNGKPLSQQEVFLLLMLLSEVTPHESVAH